jgi:hypothetical protein
MIQHIPIERVLFLDIETVPQAGSWDELSETEQHLWDKKQSSREKMRFLQKNFMKEPELWLNLEKSSALPSE